jgi:DNA repair protein RadC
MTSEFNTFPEITLQLRKGTIEKTQIQSSKDADILFRKIWDNDSLPIYESFIAIYLDRQNKSIAWYKVSQGGISGTVTDLRLIMSVGLKCLASGLLIAHNHPSGNLNPSESDSKITAKIKESGNLLDIQLLDHLIICDSDYYSFADNGLI